MFVVMNRIFVNSEYSDAFEERFRNRAHAVDQMPGFVRNMVLRPQASDHPYVVMTFWKTEEDFNSWVNSDAFKHGHAKSGTLPKEAFSQPGSLETFNAFLDTESPSS